MICSIILKSDNKNQKVLLERPVQKLLEDYLKSNLTDACFIFNYTDITYVFIQNKQSLKSVQNVIFDFFKTNQINHIKGFDVSNKADYFWKATQRKLVSRENSALEWKHFMISFLIQMDPFAGKKSGETILVFEKFRNFINKEGSKQQQKYFKNKLNMLRKRVSIDQITRLLN